MASASLALRLLALLVALEGLAVALAWALGALQPWATEAYCCVEEGWDALREWWRSS